MLVQARLGDKTQEGVLFPEAVITNHHKAGSLKTIPIHSLRLLEGRCVKITGPAGPCCSLLSQTRILAWPLSNSVDAQSSLAVFLLSKHHFVLFPSLLPSFLPFIYSHIFAFISSAKTKIVFQLKSYSVVLDGCVMWGSL